ncbi:MAG: PAS domain S-box protein [Planctomycetes bacterium]|nr:PAS domain S-box protein [Planctomycetota bacterium]
MGGESPDDKREMLDRISELTAIGRLAANMAGAETGDEFYDVIVKGVADITGALFVAVSSINPTKPEARVRAVAGDRETLLKIGRILGPDFDRMHYPMDAVPPVEILQSGVKLVRDWRQLAFDAIPETVSRSLDEALGETTLYGAALKYAGDLLGTMAIAMPADARSFSMENIGLLCDLLAAALKRRRTEEALLEMEDKFKSITADSAYACFELDLDGTVTSVNRRACEITGYAPDTLLGRKYTEILIEDHWDMALSNLQKALSEPNDGPREYTIRDADGALRHIEVNAVPLKNRSRVVGLLCTAQDVSDLKQSLAMERKYSEWLAFLSRTANELVEMGPEADVYGFIAEKIHELAGESLVTVSSYDDATGLLTCRAVAGSGPQGNTVAGPLDWNPVGTETRVSTRVAGLLKSGRLHLIPNGVRDILPDMSAASAPAHSNAEQEVFSMGFTRKGALFGCTSILTARDRPLQNANVIEAFVSQSSVAIQKKLAQEKEQAAVNRLAEQNRLNRLRAEIWKLAADTSLSEHDMIQALLDHVGPALGVGRACFNRRSGDDFVCVAEWCLDGVAPSIDSRLPIVIVQHMVDSEFAELRPETVLAGLPDDIRPQFEPLVRDFADTYDLHAVAAVAYNVNGVMEGIVSFDVCRSMPVRPAWTDAKKDIVSDLVRILSQTVAQKRTNRALQESEERFAAIFKAANDSVFMKDSSFRYVQVNPAMERLCGVAADAFLGKTDSDLFGDELGAWSASIDSRAASGLVVEEEYAAVLNGRSTALHVVEVPVRDAAGNVIGICGIARDITKRRESEEEIRRLQQFLSIVVDNANVWLDVLDEKVNVLVWNKAAERISGYSRGEVVGHGKIWQWLYPDPDYRESIVANVAEIIDGKTSAEGMETVITTKSGENRVISWHSRNLVAQDGSPIGSVALGRDITARKEAEDALIKSKEELEVRVRSRTAELNEANLLLQNEIIERRRADDALKASEHLYRTLVETSPDGIVMTDPKNRIVMLNSRAVELFGGTSAKDFLGTGFLDTVVRNNRKALDSLLRSAAASGGVKTVECLLSRRDGSTFDGEISISTLADIQDAHGGFVHIIRDVSERRNAERALADSERRFRLLTENAMDIIWGMDLDKRFTFVSPAIEYILGYTPEEALNMPLADRLSLGTSALVDAAITEELAMECAEGVDPHRKKVLELLQKRKDGSSVWTEATASFIRDETGRPVGIVGVTRDISERKRLEEERLKTQKLESLGLLAGGIAHDFNNILTAIMGNISLARMHLKNEKIHKVLKASEEAVSQAGRLTQQLLAFSRGGTPAKETASVAEILRETAEFVLRGSSISSTISIPPDLWPADVDKAQIGQVIHNLVLNALQAMPDGGTVKVEASNMDHPPPGAAALAEGRYIRISITDSGAGISPANLQNIFDPYFTTKQSGNGLGLTITYYIVKRHGGHIEVDSELEKGTAITVYLPASPDAAVSAHPAAARIHFGAGRILVMDDDKIVRSAAEGMLSYLGYTVETAVDGIDAVTKYRQAMKAGRSFDAVMMDLTVPGGMGGLEATREILASAPGAKIIVSSGYSNDPVISDYREHGFAGVMTKPYNLESLGSALHGVLNPGTR